MTNRLFRLATLALLYFVQGAPYGFQTSCLPLILRNAGLSYSALGAMKLLFIPWVCKPLYAPIIERTKSKRWWLTASMNALGLTCLLAALWTSETSLTAISGLMLLLNLFSASQDVATDSLAVMVLPEDELGAGNTVQVVAYKAGSVFAGSLLLYFRETFGWSGMFLAFASLYFVGVLLLTSLKLVEHSARGVKKSSNKMEEEDKVEPASYPVIVKRVMNVPGTLYVIAFVIFYKLCERAEQTFSLYMVDKHVPTTTLAMASTIMRSLSILGSTYGGLLLSSNHQSAKAILVKFSALRTLPILGQLIIVTLWGLDRVPDPEVTLSTWTRDAVMMYLGFVCTSATLFCAGVITTAAFTLMMRLSQEAPGDIQGTHYTTLATCEVLGKLAFASIAGGMIDRYGLQFMFFLFVALAAACFPFSLFLPSSFSSTKSQ